MKKLSLLLMFAFLLFKSQAQAYEKVKDPLSGQMMLKGFINEQLLSDTTLFKWYAAMQKEYQPQEQIVKTVVTQKDSVQFLVFLGTWCTDSHYVIPRFFKLLGLAGFDRSKVVVFALDRTKKDTTHLASTFDISHVPTIIVLKKGKEVGRVVEFGVTGKFDEELAEVIKKS